MRRRGYSIREPRSMWPLIMNGFWYDICGLMPERSLGVSWYFIMFVDDFTWKVWAYSIKSNLRRSARSFHSVANRRWKQIRLQSENAKVGQWRRIHLQSHCKVTVRKGDPASKDRSLHSDAKWCSGMYEPDHTRMSDGNALPSRTKAGVLGWSIVDDNILN